MRVCPNCGFKNVRDQAHFCAECSNKLPNHKDSRMVLLSVPVAVFVLFGITVWLWSHRGGPKPSEDSPTRNSEASGSSISPLSDPAAQIVDEFIHALQAKEYRKVLDLDWDCHNTLEGIKSDTPRSLVPKTLNQVSTFMLDQIEKPETDQMMGLVIALQGADKTMAIRRVLLLLTQTAICHVDEVRPEGSDAVRYANSVPLNLDRALPADGLSAVYVTIKYPSRADAPEEKERDSLLKQVMIRFDAHVPSHTVVDNVRVPEGTEYWPFVDDARVFGPGADATCSNESKFRSTGNGASVSFSMRNTRKDEVDVYWLDSSGKRVRYAQLFPGQQYVQQTYQQHPWLVADHSGSCLAIFLVEAGAITRIEVR